MGIKYILEVFIIGFTRQIVFTHTYSCFLFFFSFIKLQLIRCSISFQPHNFLLIFKITILYCLTCSSINIAKHCFMLDWSFQKDKHYCYSYNLKMRSATAGIWTRVTRLAIWCPRPNWTTVALIFHQDYTRYFKDLILCLINHSK